MATQEEKNDELVTRAAALVIHWLRENLKKELTLAINEIYWQLWADLFRYLYKSNWFRLLIAFMTLISALSLWLHEELK